MESHIVCVKELKEDREASWADRERGLGVRSGSACLARANLFMTLTLFQHLSVLSSVCVKSEEITSLSVML